MKCLHEEDIEYGDAMEVTENLRAIQILCSWCGGVGTQIEQQDDTDPDHWYSIGEMWHELHHYYADHYIKERKYKGIGVKK